MATKLPYQVDSLIAGYNQDNSVYKVTVNGKDYALKYIYDVSDLSMVELDILSRVRHPYIMHRELELTVKAPRNTSCESGIGFFMPLALGHLAEGFIRNAISVDGWVKYLQQILCALDFLHDHHILHLDLKPHNILIFGSGKIAEDGSNSRAVLADFDISVQTEDGVLVTEKLKYSEPFRPPYEEMEERFTSASDIWALAASFIHAITNMIPEIRSEEDIEEHVQYLPPIIKPILTSMLAINPEHRPTAKQLLRLPLLAKYDRPKGYILPPPQLPRPVTEGNAKSFICHHLKDEPQAMKLALSIYSRLGADSKEKLFIAIYIATEYYGIYRYDTPKDLVTYLNQLQGYIYC